MPCPGWPACWQPLCVAASSSIQASRSSKLIRASSFDPALAQAFGRTVRSLRLERRIAQDEFALIAGIDRSYYGKLERGERQPSLGLLLRIAQGFGISGSVLVARTESLFEATENIA